MTSPLARHAIAPADDAGRHRVGRGRAITPRCPGTPRYPARYRGSKFDVQIEVPQMQLEKEGVSRATHRPTLSSGIGVFLPHASCRIIHRASPK